MEYSLWFVPEGQVYKRFKDIIEQLSEKYNTPSFTPHITLIGNINDKDIFEKAELLSKRIGPFKVRINKMAYMEDYYRCIIALAESEEIMKAGKLARQMFKDYNQREFIPHLSLMYGEFPEHIKKEVVKEINIEEEFLVKDLNVVTTGDIPEEWSIVEKFKITKIK